MVILVVGGARSGKSGVAESLAHSLGAPVTYVATLVPDQADADLMQRIETHRRRRPATWATVEATVDLPAQLMDTAGTVLIDGLGPWVARYEPADAAVTTLLGALTTRPGDTVVVSEEVGMSVHPGTEAGRHFRDALGTLNQRLAQVADHTLLVVAGRVLPTVAFDPAAFLSGAQ
jgi:adenosyl cobinamide kinase/adenosyl cobinamide phosphate guanylyltransferase